MDTKIIHEDNLIDTMRNQLSWLEMDALRAQHCTHSASPAEIAAISAETRCRILDATGNPDVLDGVAAKMVSTILLIWLGFDVVFKAVR